VIGWWKAIKTETLKRHFRMYLKSESQKLQRSLKKVSSDTIGRWKVVEMTEN
jgi:hypothetical protein